MKRSDVVAMLPGMTISYVEASRYMMWPLTIQSIVFTDGTRIELSGNADEARIEAVQVCGGAWQQVVDDDEGP